MTNIRILSIAALLSSSGAFGATLVVPNANASATGNAGLQIPSGTASYEIQRLLGSGQFPSGTIQITGISFRAAPGTGPISATIGNLAVYVSTSPNFPNTKNSGQTLMSSTFASNVGSDNTLVFSGSNVTWSDSGCSSGPCPFDINITFSTPFSYNPANGQLLIDTKLTNFDGTSGTFDAESFSAPGGSVSQVVGSLGSSSGTFSYQGNITQVTYTTVAANTPTFSGVVNPAGNIQPGFPNYGLAQGSIFTIYGSNLGPNPYVSATTLPLPTTQGLGGTTITISQNGVSVPVPILFSYATQVNAIIPSTAPLGNDTLTVTYNGNSGSTTIPVVVSNFGIVQVGATTQAVVTFPSYAVVGPTNTASAGDELVLWGTGLGALPAGQSDASGALGGNLPANIQVFVGGVPATILYQGRTPSAAGLDQINFVVPANTPQGCNVSIIVETTNGTAMTTSNAPTIAVGAKDGATCVDPTQNVPQSVISNINNISSEKVLAVEIQQQTNYSSPNGGSLVPSVTASAATYFFDFSQAQLKAQVSTINTGAPSLNTCLTTTYPTSGNGGPQATGLNAGTSVTLTPPSGPEIIMSATSTGIYQANLTSLTGGTYQFANSGGADVAALSFSFPVPQVTWTNMTSLAAGTVTRNNGLTVTWVGGNSSGYVVVRGQGQTSNGLYTFQFGCTVPATAGTFTVPPAILLGMPTGPNAVASIEVDSNAYPASLGTISGFDDTVNLSSFQTTIPVSFQ